MRTDLGTSTVEVSCAELKSSGRKFRPYSPRHVAKVRSSLSPASTSDLPSSPWNPPPQTNSLRGILWDIPYFLPFE